MADINFSNRALALAGTRSQIADFTSTSEGKYCNLLYDEFRDFLLREGDYDFAIQNVAANPAAVNPGLPWIYGYVYPPLALRIRQLVPLVYNPLDPQPIAWNTPPAASGQVIATKVAIASIVYTYAAPEANWAADFKESFVRFLASGLFFALENRIEAHKEAIQEALSFAQMANARDP